MATENRELKEALKKKTAAITPDKPDLYSTGTQCNTTVDDEEGPTNSYHSTHRTATQFQQPETRQARHSNQSKQYSLCN